MIKGSIYEIDTGKIVMSVVAPDEEGVLLQVTGGDRQGVIYGRELNGREVYIVEGEAVDRPLMPLAYAVDGVETMGEERIQMAPDALFRVDGIPLGSRVVHAEGEAIVDDGFVEWSAVEPGHYHFRIENFPYQEVTFYAVVG